ncbi:MAG: MobC family plasmid mobilization relaxosome protein [Bradyrhizobium sp.]|nr:MobC family plasmid mobilization relaxosome protein [Bradyrhizobium sp.]
MCGDFEEVRTARGRTIKDDAAKSRCGSETRRRTYVVTTRYDEAEFAELDAAASRAGLTRASFQRVQSLSKPKTRSTRRAPVEKELLGRLLGQINKIGSNINQIARAANMGLGVRADLASALRELRDLIPVVMRALGRAAPDQMLDDHEQDDP